MTYHVAFSLSLRKSIFYVNVNGLHDSLASMLYIIIADRHILRLILSSISVRDPGVTGYYNWLSTIRLVNIVV